MVGIRDARTEDALAVAGVHVRSWQVGYRGIFPDEFLDALSVRERAARYTLGSSDPAAPRTLLAVDGEHVVGFATLSACRDADVSDAAELQALYVDPPSWGSGVGRTLIGEVYARIRAAGTGLAVLWVLEANARARGFYERYGWTPDGARREEDVWGVDARVMRYRRVLGE